MKKTAILLIILAACAGFVLAAGDTTATQAAASTEGGQLPDPSALTTTQPAETQQGVGMPHAYKKTTTSAAAVGTTGAVAEKEAAPAAVSGSMPVAKAQKPANPNLLKDPYFIASFLMDFSEYKQGELDNDAGEVLCDEYDPAEKPLKQGAMTFAMLTKLLADALLVSHEQDLQFGTNPYNEDVYQGLNDKQKKLLKAMWIAYKEYPEDFEKAMRKSRASFGDVVFMPLETVNFILFIDRSPRPHKRELMDAYDEFQDKYEKYKKTYYGCETIGKYCERALDYCSYRIENDGE